MIKYEMTNSSIKITESDVYEAEKLLNKSLPIELKNFYLKNNGGRVEGNRYVYSDDQDKEYDVQTFFPIKYKRTEGDGLLEEQTLFYCNEKRLIPDNYIVFAMDGGGFPFCCDIQSGHIYFGNIENYDGDPEEIMEFICETLEDFINNMKTEEEAYG